MSTFNESLGRKSQPIWEPDTQTKLFGNRLLKQKGSAEDKIDGLTEAVVMILETVNKLTQQGQWTTQRLHEIDEKVNNLDIKVDSVTEKIEDIWAKKAIKWMIGLVTTILGGLGLAAVVKALMGR